MGTSGSTTSGSSRVLGSVRRARRRIERSPGLAVIFALTFALAMSRGVPGISLVSLLLVFVLPGLATVAAVAPWAPLARWDTVTVAIGTSMALVVGTGLLLNFTPSGLEPGVWSAALAAITMAGAATGMVRRSWDRDSAEIKAGGSSEADSWGRPRPAEIVQILAAVAIVAALLASSRAVGSLPQSEFTQLWLLEAGASAAVEVGVRNQEADTVAYSLVLTSDGEVLQRAEFSVAPGSTWKQRFPLGSVQSGEIRADLYRLPEQSTPYRTSTLWLSEPGSLTGVLAQ